MEDTQTQAAAAPQNSSFMDALAAHITNPSPVSDATPATQGNQFSDPDLQEAFEAQEAAKQPVTPVTETVAETPSETVVETTNKKGLDAFDEGVEEATPAQPEPDEEPPAGVRTKEAREAWKSMREGSKKAVALEKQVAELQQKLANAGKITDADPAVKERDELRQWKEKMTPVIARTAFRESDAFQQKIVAPRQVVARQAMDLGKQYDIPADKIDALFSEPNFRKQDQMFEEITTDMTERAKSILANHMNKWGELDQLEDEMEQNAVVAAKEAKDMESKEKERVATERKAAEMRSVVELKPKLLNVAKLLAASGQTPEAYVDSLVEAANSIPFDEHDVSQKAYMTVAAQVLKDMAPAYRNALSKIKSLEAQVSGMSAARPGVNGTQAKQGTDPTANMGFMDALKARMQSMGVS